MDGGSLPTPSQASRCGMCSSCNSMPPWAPEALANASPAFRLALEQRMREAQRRFIVDRDARQAAAARLAASAPSPSVNATISTPEPDQGLDPAPYPASSSLSSSSPPSSTKNPLKPPEIDPPSPHSPFAADSAAPQFLQKRTSSSSASTTYSSQNSLSVTRRRTAIPPRSPDPQDSDADSFHTADDEHDHSEILEQLPTDGAHNPSFNNVPSQFVRNSTSPAHNSITSHSVTMEPSRSPDSPRSEIPLLDGLPRVTTVRKAEARRSSLPTALMQKRQPRSPTNAHDTHAPLSPLRSGPRPRPGTLPPHDDTETLHTPSVRYTGVNKNIQDDSLASATSLPSLMFSLNTLEQDSIPHHARWQRSQSHLDSLGANGLLRSAPVTLPLKEAIHQHLSASSDPPAVGQPVQPCSDCAMWRRRVQELEAKVEALAAALAAREMDIASLRARSVDSARAMTKSEARLQQECDSLRVTTEFLFSKLERYERGHHGDVH